MHRCGRAERGPLHLQPVVELAVDAHAHRRDEQQRRRLRPGWRAGRRLHADPVGLFAKGNLHGAEGLGRRWRGGRGDDAEGRPVQGLAAGQQGQGEEELERKHRRTRALLAPVWEKSTHVLMVWALHGN